MATKTRKKTKPSKAKTTKKSLPPATSTVPLPVLGSRVLCHAEHGLTYGLIVPDIPMPGYQKQAVTVWRVRHPNDWRAANRPRKDAPLRLAVNMAVSAYLSHPPSEHKPLTLHALTRLVQGTLNQEHEEAKKQAEQEGIDWETRSTQLIILSEKTIKTYLRPIVKKHGGLLSPDQLKQAFLDWPRKTPGKENTPA